MASGNFLYDSGNPKLMFCDNIVGWAGEGRGRKFKRERAYVCLWTIHVDVWQKSSLYCKVIIL